MELRQIRHAVAVADHATFTRAAAELGIAQPSLSQSIRSLEAELGTELFHRTPRGAVPTPAGEAFLGPAREALRDAATAAAAVGAVAGLVAGHLDLVCLATLAAAPVAGFVGRFRREFPGVRVRLVEPESPDAVAGIVRDGRCELGVVELGGSADDLAEVELDTEPFVALIPVAVDPVAPTRAAAAPVKLAELAELPLVTTPPGTSTRRRTDAAFAAAGVAPQIAVESDHRDALVALVAAGAGVAIVPQRLVPPSGIAGVVVRPLSPPLARRVGIVHRDAPLSPAAAAFVRIAAAGDGVGARRRPSPRRR